MPVTWRAFGLGRGGRWATGLWSRARALSPDAHRAGRLPWLRPQPWPCRRPARLSGWGPEHIPAVSSLESSLEEFGFNCF